MDEDTFAVIFGIISVIGIIFLKALIFMLIWNYAVVTALSVARELGYWHSFWLMFFFVGNITIKNRKKDE